MAEPDPMTLQDFQPHVGATFSVEVEDGRRVDAVLLEASAIETARPEGAAPGFSLVFRVPSESSLPQRIYGLDHPEKGRLALFLVPIGVREGGALMEAVFN